MKDDGHTSAEDLPEPEVIAAEILGRLQVAVGEIEGLLGVLGND